MMINTCKKYLKKLLVILVYILITAPGFSQVRIIFDTDMGSDSDDAGALAVLHKLADKKE